RRVVDENAEGSAELLAKRIDGLAQRADVAKIGARECRVAAAIAKRRRDPLGPFRIEVDESHPRALRHEMLDDAGADAGGTARHQHAALTQTRIDRKIGHDSPSPAG